MTTNNPIEPLLTEIEEEMSEAERNIKTIVELITDEGTVMKQDGEITNAAQDKADEVIEIAETLKEKAIVWDYLSYKYDSWESEHSGN